MINKIKNIIIKFEKYFINVNENKISKDVMDNYYKNYSMVYRGGWFF